MGEKEERGERRKKRLTHTEWQAQRDGSGVERRIVFVLIEFYTYIFCCSSFIFVFSLLFLLFLALQQSRKRAQDSAHAHAHPFHQVKMKTVYRKGIEIKGKIVSASTRTRTHNSYLRAWCTGCLFDGVVLCCVFYVYDMIRFGWVRFSSIRIGITNTQPVRNSIQGNRYYAMLIF